MYCGGGHIKAKLYMNVHWMVLYKLHVFGSDMKFKMAATEGLSLTLDPMGKMFQNASSLKPLGQMKRVTVAIIATYVLPKKGEGNSISTSKICIKILFIPRLKV
jgi:hypothetical protein